MEANELRIGNWVNYTKPKKKKVQITGIINSCLYYKGSKKGCLCDFQFTPIPLTKKRLIRLGFEKELNHFTIITNQGHSVATIIISIENNTVLLEDDFNESISIKMPKYIHQLQNLYFALTGKELIYE